MVSTSLKGPETWDYLTTEDFFIFQDSVHEIRHLFSVPRWTLTYEKGFRETWLLSMSLCHKNPGTQQGQMLPAVSAGTWESLSWGRIEFI